MSVFGPRGSHNGYGDSTTVGHRNAPSQDLVDVESILSNRNVIASKCKDGKVNDIDVTKFQLQHARICNDFLDPVATHLTNPSANYRGMNINRFYDLDRNPQSVLFWNFQVNTQLEAKDNFKEALPHSLIYDAMTLGIERTVSITQAIPVFITYFTAWANKNGTIEFRRDIYERDEKVLKALNEKPTAFFKTK